MSLRDELIQVAAVAMRWVALLDDNDPRQTTHRWVDLGAEAELSGEAFSEMADSDPGVWLAVLVEEVGEVARALNEATIAGWRDGSEGR